MWSFVISHSKKVFRIAHTTIPNPQEVRLLEGLCPCALPPDALHPCALGIYVVICHFTLKKVYRIPHWWLVRVTLRVNWLFLPQNFGPVVGSYEGLLLLCECRWGWHCTCRW